MVEKAILGYLSTGLITEVDVGGRQQEDLARDSLDRAMQTEDQTCGEVDDSLGVGIVHVTQVHDDRDADTKLLADPACVVVGARVDRLDTTEVAHRDATPGKRRGRWKSFDVGLGSEGPNSPRFADGSNTAHGIAVVDVVLFVAILEAAATRTLLPAGVTSRLVVLVVFVGLGIVFD